MKSSHITQKTSSVLIIYFGWVICVFVCEITLFFFLLYLCSDDDDDELELNLICYFVGVTENFLGVLSYTANDPVYFRSGTGEFDLLSPILFIKASISLSN